MKHQVFISYSGRNAFEASLLQYALEQLLAYQGVLAWTFQRDQARSENEVARSLKRQIRDSAAAVFLVSPDTLESGATQWMELAYADAFAVETFILLHRLEFGDLKNSGVPPLLLSSQCNPAIDWKNVIQSLEAFLKGRSENA